VFTFPEPLMIPPPPQQGFPAASHPPSFRRPVTPPATVPPLPHHRLPASGYPNREPNPLRLSLLLPFEPLHIKSFLFSSPSPLNLHGRFWFPLFVLNHIHYIFFILILFSWDCKKIFFFYYLLRRPLVKIMIVIN